MTRPIVASRLRKTVFEQVPVAEVVRAIEARRLPSQADTTEVLRKLEELISELQALTARVSEMALEESKPKLRIMPRVHTPRTLRDG